MIRRIFQLLEKLVSVHKSQVFFSKFDFVVAAVVQNFEYYFMETYIVNSVLFVFFF